MEEGECGFQHVWAQTKAAEQESKQSAEDAAVLQRQLMESRAKQEAEAATAAAGAAAAAEHEALLESDKQRLSDVNSGLQVRTCTATLPCKSRAPCRCTV